MTASTQYLSAWVFASSDNSFRIQSESGFGCHLMGTQIGFHADLNNTVTFGKGWHRLTNWEQRGTIKKELYALGGGVGSTGFFVAPKAGYYVCASQVRLDSAAKSSYFRLILSLNGNTDINQGFEATCSNAMGCKIGDNC